MTASAEGTDIGMSWEEYDRHRKRGLSQTREFGELLEAWQGRGGAYRFVVEHRGRKLAVQAMRAPFGPLPAIYVGIGHELELSGDEVDGILGFLSGKADVPTILQVDYVGADASRLGGNYTTPQLIADLGKGVLPDKKRRYEVRKAIEAGVEVKPLPESRAAECARLSEEFGESHGIGAVSAEVIRTGIRLGVVHGLMAAIGGETVGYALALVDRELMKTYLWMVAWNRKGLEASASSLLVQRLMEWSRDSGFREFDFSGVDFETEKKRNIAAFKRSFGGGMTSYRSARTLAFRGMSSRGLYDLVYRMYHGVYVPLHDRK